MVLLPTTADTSVFFRRYSSSSAWHLVLQNISPRETKYDLKRLTMNPETQARKKAHKTAL